MVIPEGVLIKCYHLINTFGVLQMSWLLDSASFISRNHCGKWSDWLIFLNQISNFLIFIAYMTIPLSLLVLWSSFRKRGVKSYWMIFMFVLFIWSCGLTHLMDVLAFTWPAYRFFTLIDCVTAILSIPTAVLLPGVLKRLFVREE